MTPEQIDRLIDMVVTVSGAAAEKGFALALRRVVFLAYTDLVWAAILVMICVGLIVARKKMLKLHHQAKGGVGFYDDFWGVSAGVVCALAVVCSVLAVVAAISAADRLVNSEWHAVMMLLDLVK